MISSSKVKVALIGDVHGKFNLLYDLIKVHTPDIDLIITLGDFEPVRTPKDYLSTKISQKYRDMCKYEFSEYYQGLKKIPVPTYFIGGNHEPNGFLKEIWETKGQEAVISNLYFLGYHGHLNIKGSTIGGISGNYSSKYFKRTRQDLPIRNYRHFVKEDLDYIYQLASLDILLTHDWPSGTDTSARRMFPCLSPELRTLIEVKQPSYVFSGHMHFYHEDTINNSKFIGLPILHDTTKPIKSILYKNLELIIFG